MKKVLVLLTILIASLFLVNQTLAAQLRLTLSSLPEYQNSADFRFYYSYLETNDSDANVNLYVQKEGDPWRQTKDRNKTEVAGYFQIEDADIYAGEGKYNFYAQAKTADLVANSQIVSIIIDRTSPDKVTNFQKERVGETAFRLSWTNPGNSDFYRVFIYHSKDKSFTAGSSTKIGEAGGAPNERMTFENSGLERNTTYYYALGVIDRAGNVSDLVTDAPGEVIVNQQVVETVTEGDLVATAETQVVLLPQEERGEVDGERDPLPNEGLTTEEGEVMGEEEGEVMGEEDDRTMRNRLLIIVPLVIAVIAAGFLFFKKRSR